MDSVLKYTIALVAVVLVGAVAFSVLLPDGIPGPGTQNNALTNVTVYLFYGQECPHCHEIMPFVNEMEKKYPQVNFQYLEIWHSQKNQNIYREMTAAVKTARTGVPMIIVGDKVLSGAVEIPNGLEQVIRDALKKKL